MNETTLEIEKQTPLKNAHRALAEYYAITEQIGALLRDGDFDRVLDRIKQRENVLNSLREQLINGKDLSEEKSLINSILDLDQKNRDEIKVKIDNTYQSIRDLIKEKQSVNNLRSISKMRQKKIVDVLY
ncbi:MAG: hypothetical protein ACE5HX_18365 [bacterium]